MTTIGPYIQIDKTIWVHTRGHISLSGRGNLGVRMFKVDPKTGLPGRVEKDITFLVNGKVQMALSARKQMAFDYTDLGYYTPPITDKSIQRNLKESKDVLRVAKKVQAALLAAGMGLPEARGFAGAVAQDSNFRSVAALFGESPPEITPSPRDISQELDYSRAGEFAWFLMGLFQDTASQNQVFGVLKREEASFASLDSRENFRQNMRMAMFSQTHRGTMSSSPSKNDAALRASVIQKAASLAVGSPLRVALLSLLAMEHSSPDARKEYLRRHPGADPSNHTVGGGEKLTTTWNGAHDKQLDKLGGSLSKAQKALKSTSTRNVMDAFNGLHGGLKSDMKALRDAAGGRLPPDVEKAAKALTSLIEEGMEEVEAMRDEGMEKIDPEDYLSEIIGKAEKAMKTLSKGMAALR